MFKREDLTPPGSNVKYLIRWTLLRLWGGRALYLHKIVGSDWAREPHDHPKDFVSIGLWGGYTEERYEHKGTGVYPSVGPVFVRMRSQRFTAPWFRKFPATHIHRLLIEPGKSAWTLVYVGPRKQDWGFFHEDGKRELFDNYLNRILEEQRKDG